MNRQDVIQIYQHLQDNSIQVWLTGGWGIDALLGEQTRDHKDLDVIMQLDDVVRMRAILGSDGYVLKELWSENYMAADADGVETATAFVLQDSAGRELDVHAIRFDEGGNGIPTWDAEGMIFKRQDLTGEGIVGGLSVRCLSPQTQVKCHTGYELPETQLRDLELLDEKFGVRCPND